MIARTFKASFAVKLQMPPSKGEKLAEVIAWLVSHQTDGIRS
jgi:hypothetical protein